MARPAQVDVGGWLAHWEQKVLPVVTSSGVARTILTRTVQATINDCWQKVRRRSIQQSRLD